MASFVRHLKRLCSDYGLAILLLSHPSVTGMTSGSGQSGSTAWGNSVRSRLYLERAEGDIPDPDLRMLTSKKANYGPAGAELLLRWSSGVFTLEGAKGGKPLDRLEHDQRVEQRFLELLREAEQAERHVNSNSGPNYAPSRFAAADGTFSKRQYRAAMERLFNRGRLRVEQGKRVTKIVEVSA